jgi:hypothetical protein
MSFKPLVVPGYGTLQCRRPTSAVVAAAECYAASVNRELLAGRDAAELLGGAMLDVPALDDPHAVEGVTRVLRVVSIAKAVVESCDFCETSELIRRIIEEPALFISLENHFLYRRWQSAAEGNALPVARSGTSASAGEDTVPGAGNAETLAPAAE